METDKEKTGDVGLKQDYLGVIKDMVALEQHLQHTAAKTENEKYLEILKEIRISRATHLKKMIGTKLEGENWCSIKHIALISKQLSEVGDKYLDQGKNAEAIEMYKESLEYDGICNLIISIGDDRERQKNMMREIAKEIHIPQKKE